MCRNAVRTWHHHWFRVTRWLVPVCIVVAYFIGNIQMTTQTLTPIIGNVQYAGPIGVLPDTRNNKTTNNKDDRAATTLTVTTQDTQWLQQDRVKTPLPIFVASLPKSGTTTIARFFYCNHINTAHTFVRTPDQREMRVGECFWNNVQKNQTRVWHGCGNYSVYSDAGFVRGKRCYYPSVHGLDHLYKAYKQQTWILVKRNATAWHQSLLKWKGGNLIQKWRACPGFPPKDPSKALLETFYEDHTARLREFAHHHPSITFIQIHLEDPTAGKVLADALGLNASCWGHHNSHEKRMRLNPKFRTQFLNQQAKLNASEG